MAVTRGRAARWGMMTVVVAAATAASGATRVIQPDPAKDVVRVRLTVTSRAASVKVTTEGATITNTSVEDVSGGIGERPVIEGGSVGYTGNVPPFEVDVSIRLTLARVRGSRVSFRVERARRRTRRGTAHRHAARDDGREPRARAERRAG